MADKQVDLLRRDECQPLTTEQMADIKSQFHPSNTANVNIVPYHIYDADEHIVGEWRETIDGVKKKKSVYERVIFGTTPATAISALTIADVTGLNITKIDGTVDNRFSVNTLVLNSSYSAALENASSCYVDGAKTGLRLIVGNNLKSLPFSVIIQYTKTSDEWQPV